MKLSRFQPAFIALLCSAGFLHADIVVLKDGKRLEGTITDEKPDKIHMRYKLTAKIWDDKDIPRTDIIEIIHTHTSTHTHTEARYGVYLMAAIDRTSMTGGLGGSGG